MGIRNVSLSSLCCEKNFSSASMMINGAWCLGSESMRQQGNAGGVRGERRLRSASCRSRRKATPFSAFVMRRRNSGFSYEIL